MTQKEKAIVKDIVGMLKQLVECEEKSEQDVTPGQEKRYEDLELAKKMSEDELQGIQFVAIDKHGNLAHGSICGELLNGMLQAYIEKYG